MPFLDLFRSFFGLNRSPEPPQHSFEEGQRYRNSFRNPIWENDDDEEDINDFSRHPRSSFSVYSDPFQITRFFESQIDEMLSNFFGGFDGFGNHFPNNFGTNEGFTNTFSLPSPPVEKFSKGPRDEVLKPESKTFFDEFSQGFTGSISSEKPCDEVLKPAFEMPDPNNKVDSDIDGKIKSDELAKIWKSPSSSQVQKFSPQISIQSFGSSVSTQIVRRPDGSVEERRTSKDSNGNEETKITRQIGDKVHTIISRKSKDGSETKTEDIVNMDESELKGFDENWTKIKVPDHGGDGFPWYKFFGPYPKL